MIPRKSLTERAAEAMNSGRASSEELHDIKREVSARIDAIELELKRATANIDKAERTGDLAAVSTAEQAEADLRRENRLLCRQRSELHQAFTAARGNEAVKATPKLQKKLRDAAEKALKAQAMLRECEAAARQVQQARAIAAEVGGRIDVDSAAVQTLAAAIYAAGPERERFMVEFGVRPVMSRKIGGLSL